MPNFKVFQDQASQLLSTVSNTTAACLLSTVSNTTAACLLSQVSNTTPACLQTQISNPTAASLLFKLADRFTVDVLETFISTVATQNSTSRDVLSYGSFTFAAYQEGATAVTAQLRISADDSIFSDDGSSQTLTSTAQSFFVSSPMARYARLDFGGIAGATVTIFFQAQT